MEEEKSLLHPEGPGVGASVPSSNPVPLNFNTDPSIQFTPKAMQGERTAPSSFPIPLDHLKFDAGGGLTLRSSQWGTSRDEHQQYSLFTDSFRNAYMKL